ncbi:NAD(P)-binding protein [Sistotremastrum suecicum HHB10207 ss-3]|uniref:NAD(P)-binding protein n=1 Tax=Sistotremastrum suecicum HHB10207 ss-3 TaxID=1314776 RepID=A0A166FAB4_9AGAM|nr:NAD(P)-binding protein [Sistotremastrum suecicum HHB10207 ss-3]
MTFPETYTHYTLASRPKSHIQPDTFKKQTSPFSSLLQKLNTTKDGVLVAVDWISLDPAARGWLNDVRSYIPPVGIGETMRAGGIGRVVGLSGGKKEGEGGLKVGDVVSGSFGWAEYAVVREKDVEKLTVPSGAQTLDFLGVLGLTGLTAYFGLLDVGQIKPGETLLVSGAAGATGSIVCQIGKLRGAKVIALAGSDDKCSWLEKELGVDRALNYKSKEFKKDFREAVGYLDVFFDNVGGDILNLALGRLKKNARIVVCGAISQYNAEKPQGLTAYQTLISQRAKMQGFIVFDYADRYPEAIKEMSEWIREGKLKRKFHIVKGLDKAPESLGLLFTGGNTGKL